jgi:molybdopterin converting factor small subunit
VTVELLGLARFRAGVSEVRANGQTVGELLADVIRECPRLAGLIAEGGGLSRQYLVSVDGERFIDDLGEPVLAGRRLLVLGADPGG